MPSAVYAGGCPTHPDHLCIIAAQHLSLDHQVLKSAGNIDQATGIATNWLADNAMEGRVLVDSLDPLIYYVDLV